jgi:hypothetical protein
MPAPAITMRSVRAAMAQTVPELPPSTLMLAPVT